MKIYFLRGKITRCGGI